MNLPSRKSGAAALRISPERLLARLEELAGIGHNPAEHTEPAHLAAGADVLLHALLELAA